MRQLGISWSSDGLFVQLTRSTKTHSITTTNHLNQNIFSDSWKIYVFIWNRNLITYTLHEKKCFSQVILNEFPGSIVSFDYFILNRYFPFENYCKFMLYLNICRIFFHFFVSFWYLVIRTFDLVRLILQEPASTFASVHIRYKYLCFSTCTDVSNFVSVHGQFKPIWSTFEIVLYTLNGA